MGLPKSTSDRLQDQYTDGPRAGAVDWPAIRAAAVTPNDSADLSFVTRGLYVGAGGDVKVDMAETGTVTFVGVGSGTLLPIRVKRVYATGTSAGSMLALD